MQTEQRRRTWLFVIPAMAVLIVGLLVPSLQTLWLTLFDGASFVGSDHLRWLVNDGSARVAIGNTIIWVVIAAVGSTTVGLVLAVAADRLRAGRLVTLLVTVPTALSMVGAAVVWRLMYAFRASGTDQVGVLNAVVTRLGLEPVAWLVQPPVNTVLLVAVLIWVQTGIAMLVLTVAVRGVPGEQRDAASMDGASELQIFRHVTAPTIKGAIAVASMTTAIASIKVFDLVKVATDGRHGTTVVATEMYDQGFVMGDAGRASTMAVLMAALLVPLAVIAVRRMRAVEASR